MQDVVTGRVTITAQNHGYAVDAGRAVADAYVSHINLNDQTVEGIALRTEPLHHDPVPFRGLPGAAGQHRHLRPVRAR